MIRRPPRSTLFPTRRSSDLELTEQLRLALQSLGDAVPQAVLDGLKRSEEHTSELQSLAYLVCRLLLEKKKKTLRLVGVEATPLCVFKIGSSREQRGSRSQLC